MLDGFFDRTALEVIDNPTPTMPLCGKCGLYKGCRSPKMPVAGKGKKWILIVGEAPGEAEDLQGRPFVGQSGAMLQAELTRNGISIFEDCWVTNALSCRPPSNKITNPRSVEYCRPLVLNAIEELKPKVILLIGASAVKSVIGHVWSESVDGLARWIGTKIPLRRWNTWIIPTYHPAFLMRDQKDTVSKMVFDKAIRTACRINGRPYDKVPTDQVETIISPSKAVGQLKNFMLRSYKPIAFDFETNCLKPDHAKAEIVCCSISDGEHSIAFPWTKETKETMTTILRDRNFAKIGWNAKFEGRWCLAKMGILVRGWKWDGMTTTHAIDSRNGITSLKFQAFVKLGVEDYSSRIKPYLQAKDKGGNSLNRIREVPLEELLEYCAKDSLYEWQIGMQQMKFLGVKL